MTFDVRSSDSFPATPPKQRKRAALMIQSGTKNAMFEIMSRLFVQVVVKGLVRGFG